MGHRDHLDVLLYVWLSEEDEQRAQLKFGIYFRRAFSETCRFVRSLQAPAAEAEDISQQALIKLFKHLGPRRRAADDEILAALAQLHPLAYGPLHVRLVQAWIRGVNGFRDAAIGFRVPDGVQKDSNAWREQRQEINARIDPLTRQGWHLVAEVRTRVEPALLACLKRENSTPLQASRQEPVEDERVSFEESGTQTSGAPQINDFVATLIGYAEGRDSAEVENAIGCTGAVGFVRRTGCVCRNLPALAIPSNGLLYTIAKRQFLDVLKSKRAESALRALEVADGDRDTLLDELDLNGSELAPVEAEGPPLAEQSAPDGREERDVESRFEDFLEFLRAPLTRAEGALAEAERKGKASAQRARVDSLRAKFDRLMAVLQALRESPQPTEDEIARRLGLTRNQVKYVIERVREEFSHFFPDLAGEAQGRRKHQG
jgi:DNA-directed RNA polymerase specialized sigma24 family protein